MVKKKRNRRGAINIRIVFFTILLSCLSFTLARYYPTVRNNFIDKTIEKRFILNNIYVSGIDNIKEDGLLKLMPVSKGMPVVNVDVKAIMDIVQNITWVDTVSIYVQYPDSLHLEITEKDPAVVTKRNEKFIVVDDEGGFLTSELFEKYASLPVVLARKEKIPEIIEYMKTQPDFYDTWEKAEFISDRRWNVFLDGDVKIMLPEHDIGEALERLNELKLQGELFRYKVKSIDLRFPNKAIVK